MNEPLSDETKVPLKWVFALLSCSGGALILAMSAMVWLSDVANTADAAASVGDKHEAKFEKMYDALISIDRRLANIEGALSAKTAAP